MNGKWRPSSHDLEHNSNVIDHTALVKVIYMYSDIINEAISVRESLLYNCQEGLLSEKILTINLQNTFFWKIKV